MSDGRQPDRGAAAESELTQLLHRTGRGEDGAKSALLDRVHGELREIARRYMAAERPGHTLQATALVHEAYVRLLGSEDVPWASRAHFYAAAAESMRRILVEHARGRARVKRGGGRRRLPAHAMDLATSTDPLDTLSIDEALDRLEADDARAAAVVKLRFFAGLSVEETASALEVSERTVMREWAYARAWLFRAYTDDDA